MIWHSKKFLFHASRNNLSSAKTYLKCLHLYTQAVTSCKNVSTLRHQKKKFPRILQDFFKLCFVSPTLNMSQNCVSFATPIFSKYNLTVFTYCYKLEQRFNTEDHGAITLYCIWTNLLQLHRPKNNHRKIIITLNRRRLIWTYSSNTTLDKPKP